MKKNILSLVVIVTLLPSFVYANKQRRCSSYELETTNEVAKCIEITNKACFSPNNETLFTSLVSCKRVAKSLNDQQLQTTDENVSDSNLNAAQ